MKPETRERFLAQHKADMAELHANLMARMRDKATNDANPESRAFWADAVREAEARE
jgi:hypothetical protein